MSSTRKQLISGFAILQLLVALMVIIPAGVGVFMMMGRMKEDTQVGNDTTVANQYASELLELFLSLTNDYIHARMRFNPFNPAMSPYRLCSHINILDRSTADLTIVNNDPIADLPAIHSLGQPVGSRHPPNRFYMLQVVNKNTMAIQKNRCAQSTAEFAALDPDERFLVTVGVSWVPLTSTDNIPKRVVLTSMVVQ